MFLDLSLSAKTDVAGIQDIILHGLRKSCNLSHFLSAMLVDLYF